MTGLSTVAKNFGATQVLHDINLKIEAGEVVVIIGPSGPGRSILLRCANKLEEISSETLLVTGTCITDPYTNEYDIRREAGMMLRRFHLFSYLTALENIMFDPVRVRKQSKAAVRERALALLGRVGLRKHANHCPAELSGGQQQHMVIACTLAVKPKAILFDEPASALDPELRHEVLKAMYSLAEEGTTMVIVTYEIDLAREVASRLIFVDGGTTAEDGSPEALLTTGSSPRSQEFLQHVSRT